jgi:hypothetical protein
VKQYGALRPRERVRAGLCCCLDAKGFDKPTVLDAGWTRGFAASASEAKVQVAANFGVKRDASVGQCPHEVDASARSVRFGPKLCVRGTGREAQTAMDAIEKQLVVDAGRLGRLRRGCKDVLVSGCGHLL